MRLVKDIRKVTDSLPFSHLNTSLASLPLTLLFLAIGKVTGYVYTERLISDKTSVSHAGQ